MARDFKTYQKEWAGTERGKECRRRALKKYNATPKARAIRKAYTASGKGRISVKKYSVSYRGVLQALRRRAKLRHEERWPNDPTTLAHAELIDLWRSQKGLCALSGIEMTWGRGSMKSTSLSIDRIDSTRGYHLDNIRLICTAINAFRGNGTDAEMIELAKAIVAFNSK